MSDASMQKESYADFSIIYKYCEQKKANDEQIRKLNNQIEDLTETVNRYKGKLNRREETIMTLTKEKEELTRNLADNKKKLETISMKYKEINEELKQSQALINQLDPKGKYH